MKKTITFLLTILSILSMSSISLAMNNLESNINTNLKSEYYVVSEENLVISRILPQTSIKDFQEKIQSENSVVRIYDKDGKKEIKQGYIGSGMKVKIGDSTKIYTVSVIGDLTGDGEIKQFEVSKVIKHVVGLEKYQLTGIDFISADVSGDGKVTQKDVSLLIKYVVYGQLDIEELIKPTAPILKVTSGVKGENNWYTSQVSLKVSKPTNSPIEISRMVVEITGTINKEATTINDGESITILDDGIYEIKCYSETVLGVKSAVTIQQIQIDQTVPISANLIAKLGNENGEIYQFNTVANQKIYLTTAGGQDEISDIQEITLEATGANVLPKGTKGPVILEKNGRTEITLTTKNKAGLTIEKKYTVVIDRVVNNPGTIEMRLNNQNGQEYIEDTWTNQNVYVEVLKGGEDVITTYLVEGSNQIAETSNPVVLTEEGISTITVINTNTLGNVIKNLIKVKIDKKIPQQPIVEINGEKIDNNSEWYTSDVQVKMTGLEESEAPLQHIKYEIKNMQTNELKEETINSGGTLTIVKEGKYEVKAYSIDEAGNQSEPEVVQINIDKTDPVSGTMNLWINQKDGEIYVNNTWTNQDIYAELVEGTDSLSGHSNTVYRIEGKEDFSEQPFRISTEGTYKITVITTDIAGRKAERNYQINIDKTKPQAPQVQVIEGTKQNDTNEWYLSDVKLEVIQGNTDAGGSGISYTTYKANGSAEVAETKITDHTILSITEDGDYIITAYNYDVAGNKSDGTVIQIKVDKTAPTDIQLEVSELKGKSFHLTASTTESGSGVVLYQFYVDGQLYKEIETNENSAEIDVTEMSSKVHDITVKIKDLAGNIGENTIQVNMGRLEFSDIDYVEFVINNFTKMKDNSNVTTGSDFIVSDTSISDTTKYIQISSSDIGVIGEVAGTIRIVRKDGEIVEKFEYFPAELLIEISQFSDGSGSKWEHTASVNMLNNVLSNEDIEEGQTNNANIGLSGKQDSDNIFSISDKKISGTKTYTRLIIRQVTYNGEKIAFKITNSIL